MSIKPHEQLHEVTINIKQSVYEWLSAKAEAARDKTGEEFDVGCFASAELEAAMNYFTEEAENDAAVEKSEADRALAEARGEDMSAFSGGTFERVNGIVTIVPHQKRPTGEAL